MNNRSSWLHHTRDYLKQDLKGRRYYRVHKNYHDHSPFADEKSPTNQTRKLREEQSSTPSPTHIIKLKNSTFKPSEDKDLTQVLIKKDTELNLLRQLYNEANEKLRTVEKIRFIEGNLKNLPTNDKKSPPRLPQIDSFIQEKSSNGNHTPLPELNNKRNKSTPSCKYNIFPEMQSHSLFQQPVFTKNRPKIILGNPITGLASPIITSKYF